MDYEKNGVYTYTMNLDADLDMEKKHFGDGLTDTELLVLVRFSTTILWYVIEIADRELLETHDTELLVLILMLLKRLFAS